MVPLKRWFVILSLFVLSCAAAPRSAIYDENADARHDIAAAIQNAGKSNRNIVLIFGANW